MDTAWRRIGAPGRMGIKSNNKGRPNRRVYALALELLEPRCFLAADVALAVVSKTLTYTQTSAGTPTVQSAYQFGAQVQETTATPATVTSATMQVPTSGTTPLTGDTGTSSFELYQQYTTQAAMDAADPSGVYVITVNTVHDGTHTFDLNLAGNAYPNTPQVQNFTSLQALNPDAVTTITWNAFAGGSTSDYIRFEIDDSLGNMVFATGAPGSATALNGTATGITLPARLLQAGNTYNTRVMFSKIMAGSTTDYTGVPGYAAFSVVTFFTLQTDSAAHMMHLNYVTQLYQDLLGRAPDPGGLSAWVALLDGGTTYNSIALSFTSSVEYDADVVDGLYMQYLGRPAEPGGLADWVNLMQGGYNAEQIRAGILGSAEYFSDTGGTNALFVTALYSAFLHRAPDPGGFTDWTTILNTGADTRQDVAARISNSDENRTDIITGFYAHYLHRAPDPGGLAAWKDLLANGVTQPQIITGFVTAPEYLGLYAVV